MIELDLTDEQQAVREVLRSLATDLLAPAAAPTEQDGVVPARVRDALSDSGITEPVPERHGGGGLPGTLTQVVAAEELGAGDPGIALAAFWAGAASLLVATCGSPTQQDAWFAPPAGRAARVAAVALYEGYGRTPAEYRTTVTPDAAGCAVAGRKVAVALAAVADDLVVVGNDPQGRLRAVLVPAGEGGTSVHPAPENGSLALGATGMRTVSFDSTVPLERLLGGMDADADVLARAVSGLRLIPAAVALGSARRAVEYAADYANGRMAFGKAISSFQGVSFLLAEAAIRIAAARLELWDVASCLDGDATVTHTAVSQAVNHACAVSAESTRDALQVLGGHGFITDHPVERWYRSTAAISTIDSDPTCTIFAPAL